jgi:hypothetical protein
MFKILENPKPSSLQVQVLPDHIKQCQMPGQRVALSGDELAAAAVKCYQ